MEGRKEEKKEGKLKVNDRHTCNIQKTKKKTKILD
jgi:hypothetical protein